MALKMLDEGSSMTIGSKSLFYSELLKWQKTLLGCPTADFESDAQSSISGRATSIAVDVQVHSSQESVESLKKESEFILANVLQTAGHAGQYILKFYDSHTKLTEQVRKDMTDIIVRYAFDNNIHLSPAITLSIIKQIIRTFPTETDVSVFKIFICF